MAARFKPLNLANPDLFGVGLSGIVGRSDKKNLLELADRCLEKGKVKLVLDLSELKSIGGGGATILADFQKRLQSQGGEAVIAGAGDVVQRFLVPKFADLPLRFFESPEAAAESFAGESAPKESSRTGKKAAPKAAGKSEQTADTAKSSAAKQADKKPSKDNGEGKDKGKSKGKDEGLSAMNEVLEEFNGSSEEEVAYHGRRKDHQYTSLSDAVGALGSWDDYQEHTEYATTLRNLLFSHGLADDALLLVEREDMMEDADQEWQLPMNSSLVRQLAEVDGSLTILDIAQDDLDEHEITLLEEVNPDIILPVHRDGSLAAVLMLNRAGDEQEFSVAEHFALELLLRVLEDPAPAGRASAVDLESGDRAAALPVLEMSDEATAAGSTALPEEWSPPRTSDATTSQVLLQLALNLPDADDRPHFWRLFARHTWNVMPLRYLAFLGPAMSRPQVVAGDNSRWTGLDLSDKKLQSYFRGMERPVATENLPAFFKGTKVSLADSGADWLITLKWDGEYLGTAIIGLEAEYSDDNPAERLMEIFAETSRLLARFDGSNDNADINLNLVKLLLGEREKRCFGHDQLTEAIVDHVHRLARVMGFPPDQERNLTYGCLLRDIGLMSKGDDLMVPPEEMDPTQWPVYRRHPEDGATLLAKLNLPQTIVDVVHCHHERFNGEGFPRGIAGREIPLAARLVTVVENYVSMVIGTGGREPIQPDTAARIMSDNLGQRYDPDIVNLFLQAIRSDSDKSGDGATKKKAAPARKRVLQKV